MTAASDRLGGASRPPFAAAARYREGAPVALAAAASPLRASRILCGTVAAAFAAAGALFLVPSPGGPKVSIGLAPTATVPPFRSGEPATRGAREPRSADAGRLAALLDFDLLSVAAGDARVPRLWLATLPPEISATAGMDRRKEMFIKILLPLVLKANEEIAADRQRLLSLIQRRQVQQQLSVQDRIWWITLAQRYEAPVEDLQGLLSRVDGVPPSLALAQAAKESGWGTSRFASEGNALFGQWIYSADGHMEPRERAPGKTHYVQSFPSLLDSVRTYAYNLNTHPAYAEFRAARARLRRNGVGLDGVLLASEMLRYAEIGPAYVSGIRRLIAANRLDDLDRSTLAPDPPARRHAPDSRLQAKDEPAPGTRPRRTSAGKG